MYFGKEEKNASKKKEKNTDSPISSNHDFDMLGTFIKNIFCREGG